MSVETAPTQAQIQAVMDHVQTPQGASEWSVDPVGVLERNGVSIPTEHRADIAEALRTAAPVSSATFGSPCWGCVVGWSTAITSPVIVLVGAVGALVMATGGADLAAAPAEIAATITAEVELITTLSGIEGVLIKQWLESAWGETHNPLNVVAFLATHICENKGQCH